MRRNYELYSRNTFFCEKKCILCFLIKSVNVNAVAVNRLVFLDLYIHINFDFDHDTKINMTRIHLKHPVKNSAVCARTTICDLHVSCFAIFKCHNKYRHHRIHSIHPSKPQTPHNNSVFTQFIFFAFHFRSADFSGLCFFQVFFFSFCFWAQLELNLCIVCLVKVLFEQQHNDLTFAQDKVSSFR